MDKSLMAGTVNFRGHKGTMSLYNSSCELLLHAIRSRRQDLGWTAISVRPHKLPYNFKDSEAPGSNGSTPPPLDPNGPGLVSSSINVV
ncbi:hypothetical protein TNCT_686601 [Trichonephila clavata]|uniref:Uncharacterized protein n=1 Tax=Trichonephila clavata TaxID=2740835 RepID=A0A8X6JLP9_TRICU|nr:hypothetical protein TNCT_686601 [Trichonephila clavata]